MSTTPNKAARAADLRKQVSNCLNICQLEMSKASPDLDYAHEFAYKAMRFIETLRIMAAGDARRTNGGGV